MESLKRLVSFNSLTDSHTVAYEEDFDFHISTFNSLTDSHSESKGIVKFKQGTFNSLTDSHLNLIYQFLYLDAYI